MDSLNDIKQGKELKEEAKITSSIELEPEKTENISMGKSHLRRSLESKSKKSLALTSLGIFTIIILFAIFGQTILVNFSILLGKGKSNAEAENTIKEETVLFIPAPVLSSSAEATNSASIDLAGTISFDKKVKIKLYVNDELADVLDIENNEEFDFKNVLLKEGDNEIKAVSVFNSKTSENSNLLNIRYIKGIPSLTIDFPSDGTSFSGASGTLEIKGKTDSGNTVKINDFIAITKNDGSFTYNYKLQNGENKIKIVALDIADNKTEKELTIQYSP